MKKLITTALTFTCLSAFGQNASIDYICNEMGPESIRQHTEFLERGIESKDINYETEDFYLIQIEEMKKNLNYICNGVRLSDSLEMSDRERLLSSILEDINEGKLKNHEVDMFIRSLVGL